MQLHMSLEYLASPVGTSWPQRALGQAAYLSRLVMPESFTKVVQDYLLLLLEPLHASTRKEPGV